jgi:hypothetical protein
MLRIEFDEPNQSVCECCGSTTVTLTRFVYKDDDAYAVYYAAFTPQHKEKVVCGIIGLGEWGDDSLGPQDRVAFPFEIRATEDQFHVGMVDADASPWSETTFLGQLLNRDEALKHEWISEVFHITDHMVTDDEEIVRYFSGSLM